MIVRVAYEDFNHDGRLIMELGMNMFKVRLRYWLLALTITLVCGGYVVYWQLLARRVERGFEEWAVARLAEGYDVKFESYQVGGFPGRLALSIKNPYLADPRHHAAWSWSAEDVVAYVQPWNLFHVIVDFGLRHDLSWQQKDLRQVLKVAATSAKASFRIDKDMLERMDVDLLGLTLSGAGLSQSLYADRAQVHQRLNHGEIKERPAGSYDFSVQATNMALPPDQAGPLGPMLKSMRFDFLLAPPFPMSPDELEIWRDQGGAIDLNSFQLHWGPLEMQGNGTVSLDKQMRPLAAISSEVQGFNETIDRLTEVGRIKAEHARAAKRILSLLAKPSHDGRPTLNLPITAQDGLLFVGPVNLMAVEPLPMIRGRNKVQ